MFWGLCACPAPLLGRHWWPTIPFRLEATVLIAAFSSERSPPNRSLHDSVSILTPHPGLPSLLRLSGSISVACIQGNLKWCHSSEPISERIFFFWRACGYTQRAKLRLRDENQDLQSTGIKNFLTLRASLDCKGPDEQMLGIWKVLQRAQRPANTNRPGLGSTLDWIPHHWIL